MPGADYACPESSIDLRGNLSALPEKERAALQGVCRVCAAGAAALCAAHGERCAAFELNTERTVATLKSSECTARVPATLGNAAVLKVDVVQRNPGRCVKKRPELRPEQRPNKLQQAAAVAAAAARARDDPAHGWKLAEARRVAEAQMARLGLA